MARIVAATTAGVSYVFPIKVIIMVLAKALLWMIVGVLATAPAARSQIIPANDGTGTMVNAVGNQFAITKGTASGQNLFHSFQQFDLPSGRATFDVPGGIQNILTRVTGGNASLIQGQLAVNGANLYFMNPSGVIFGQGASLNVSGAFVTTTANGIGFGNGNWFSAIGNNNYAALTGTPTQFAFTEKQAGSIVQAADGFTSQPEQSIVLIGGTIFAPKTWETQGGVGLATVSGQQVVNLTLPGSLLSLSIKVDPLQFGQSAPNRWTVPIQSLPSLLTGPGVQSATNLQVNPDGSITLTAPPLVTPLRLTVQPGDIAIHSLKTPPSTIGTGTIAARNQYDVIIDAQNTFRAVGTLPNSSVNSNRNLAIPVSLRTIGKITIRHSGTAFTEGIGYQRDVSGIVLEDPNDLNRRVLFDNLASGSGATQFKYADNGSRFDASLPTSNINAIVDPTFNPANTSPNQSYTKGIIAIQSNNGNGALLGVLQDSTLPSRNDIKVLATIRRLPVTPDATVTPDTTVMPSVSTIDLTRSVTCQNEVQSIASASTPSASTRSKSEPRCKSQVNLLPAPSSDPILTIDPKL